MNRRGFLSSLIALPAAAKAWALAPKATVITIPSAPAAAFTMSCPPSGQVFKVGDVFTVSGCYDSGGSIREFVVTADVTSHLESA